MHNPLKFEALSIRELEHISIPGSGLIYKNASPGCMKERSEWVWKQGNQRGGCNKCYKAVIVGALEETPDFRDGQGGIFRI